MSKNNKNKWYFKPIYWSILFLMLAQLLTLACVYHQQPFLDKHQIEIPEQPTTVIVWPTSTYNPDSGVVTPPTIEETTSSVGVIILYMIIMITLVSIILAIIPISALSTVFRIVFSLLFAWGIFVMLVLWLPWDMALGIAISISFVWFIYPSVWLHDVIMLVTMVSIASLFGRLINPMTAMIIMLAMAIYDFISVKKGLMIWMVNKLSNVNTLPAFVIPSDFKELNDKLTGNNIKKLAGEVAESKDYSLIGGGDIAFPLIITSACYFGFGLLPALIIIGASIIGIIAVYIIQDKALHGNPMAALPPITVCVLIAFIGIMLTR